MDVRLLLWRAYRPASGLLADMVSSTGLTKLPIVWPALKAIGAMEYAVRRFVFASPEERLATVQGHRMYLGAYADAGFLYDTYEPGTTKLFQRLVGPGMTVMDVGAHWGYFTLLAARGVGEGGRVYAFEPHPDNWALLVKNVQTNGYSNVVAVQKAVADRAGQVPLFLGKSDAGCNSLYRNPLTREESIPVEVTTLDAFLEREGGPRVDLIKIDIEGGEPAALEGARGLVQRSGNLGLIVEFHPRLLGTAGTTPEEFVDRLLGWGLRVQVIDGEGGLTPLHLPTLLRELKGFGYVNLFCEAIS
ncbi:MAG: FkbM family methyltransferase [Chloroflexi bacterium]|nr:FkbM family methyltransferase [Chloroflexota bacterium]